LSLAREHHLKVVEDHCVSQGTRYRRRLCGTLGDAAAFSLQQGKLTSAGEGGMFLTNDAECYQRAAVLGHYERLAGLPDEKYRAMAGFCLGEKYRIATLSAAIGCVQLRAFGDRLAVQQRNTELLGEALAEVGGFDAPPVPDYAESPYHRRFVRFHPEELSGIDRATLIAALRAEGVPVVKPLENLRPLHLHPAFSGDATATGDLLWQVLGPAAQRITYSPNTLPVTEDPEVPYNVVQVPRLTRPAEPLIAMFQRAFAKVAAQASALATAG
jgi:perosamine synthetase